MVPGDAPVTGLPVTGLPRWHPVAGHPHLDVPVLLLAFAGFTLVLVTGLAVRRAASLRPAADPPLASWEGSLTGAQKVVRAVSLAVTVLCIVAARTGSPSELDNLAPALVLGVGWPLLFLGALLAPGLWRWTDPWDTAARLLDRADRSGPSDDVRPAVVVALPLLWFLAVHRNPLDPRDLGLALAVYVIAMVAGSMALGRHRWLSSADPVGIVLTWIGRARPARASGRRTPQGLAALLGVVAAGTLTGLLRRTEAWSEVLDPTDQLTTTLAWLACTALGAALVTVLAQLAEAGGPRDRTEGRQPARSVVVLAFAPAVAGIVVAAALARNRLTNSLQLLPGLVGDPFGRGWELLGDVGLEPAPLDPVALLATQLAVVTACHLWGAVTVARLLPRPSRLAGLVLLAQSAAGSVAVLSAH
jgi:hypothetical protein